MPWVGIDWRQLAREGRVDELEQLQEEAMRSIRIRIRQDRYEAAKDSQTDSGYAAAQDFAWSWR